MLAVCIDRFEGKAFIVEHLIDRMVHGFVQLIGKGLADQLVGDEVGYRHVQRDQRLAQVFDVEIVDLFDQPVCQIRFIKQAFKPGMTLEQLQWLGKVLLGNFKYRLD